MDRPVAFACSFRKYSEEEAGRTSTYLDVINQKVDAGEHTWNTANWRLGQAGPFDGRLVKVRLSAEKPTLPEISLRPRQHAATWARRALQSMINPDKVWKHFELTVENG